MAVKTNHGMSERQIIRNSVLQGDTWGSLLTSVQVEKIGQECIKEGHYYLSKNVLPADFWDW